MQEFQIASGVEKVLALIEDPNGAAAPGCAVAIFRDGRSEFVFSGFADVAARRRPDADTLYYAGSLAKQFTALAIVQLVLAGRVDLQNDVRCYLPEMPSRSPAITVAMLLHHTSGLPNYARLAPLAGYQRPSDIDRDETLRTLMRYPGGAFPPGTTFEYSNGGYLLLSAIVERVSGESFANYVEAHILRPLDMTRSIVLQGAFPDDPNRARGYRPGETGFMIREDVPQFGGAGAMMFTLNDLARYFHDIASGGLVWTSEVARLMTAPGLYSDGSPVILPVPEHLFGYAGGLMLSRDWILHGGNFDGFQAMFGWLPLTGNGIAILCNRGDVDPLKLAAGIMAAVAPDLPALDTPRFTLQGPGGRFVSDTVATVYDIAALGDENLEVTITPPGRVQPMTLALSRTADGVFACGAITLVFDPDRRGFRTQNENVSLRFRRAS
jgi:CubicO group peptidase (beta-lactamase class C family)